MRIDPSRRPVTCEIDGKTYQASYAVAGKILTVYTAKGGKSRQVGEHAPAELAEKLLRELVTDLK